MKRGDNIPSVSDYAHWGEDAYYMWYSENKYDMEHWDEEIEDDWDDREYYEPEPDIAIEFDTEQEAREFFDRPQDWGYSVPVHSMTLGHYTNRNGQVRWYVEGYTKESGEKATEINRKNRGW
jgi:hypothetical protein